MATVLRSFVHFCCTPVACRSEEAAPACKATACVAGLLAEQGLAAAGVASRPDLIIKLATAAMQGKLCCSPSSLENEDCYLCWQHHSNVFKKQYASEEKTCEPRRVAPSDVSVVCSSTRTAAPALKLV